ncbi:glycosyltransferase family 8 protein [Paenibacillus cookii]|nr:glycosyltransferase family 8 protein [Paenibacillus cookii]KHF33074.1 General stress protein A [Paenibacillus sp. P1XP2]
MIELALAFNDKDGSYSEHAGVVLASVFRHTGSPVNVHILHDETLTEENKNRLTELVSGFNNNIHFYPVTIPPEMAEALSGTGSLDRWTWGSLYRLLLPSLIQVDKVIYLDCDVLVNMDIAELWNIDLNGYYLAAVRDQGILGIAGLVMTYGLNPETYFNSGVIVFALNNIRQKMNWYEETLHFWRSYPGTTMPDQDALNHVFGGNSLLLDERFNSFCLPGSGQDLNNKIVHFAGDTKMWDPLSEGYGLYQELLGLTPWKTPVVPPATPRTIKKRRVGAHGRYYLAKPGNRKKRLERRRPMQKTKRVRKIKPAGTKRLKTIRFSLNAQAPGTRRKSKRTAMAPRIYHGRIRSKKQGPNHILWSSKMPAPPFLDLR